MKDTTIKGSGNSRIIKAPPNIANMAPDHAALLDLLRSGLPVDLSGPVAAGCDVVGTPLNKANLMTDATETAIWGNAADRNLDAALAQLRALIKTAQNTADTLQVSVNSKLEERNGYYYGTGQDSKTIEFGFNWRLFVIIGKYQYKADAYTKDYSYPFGIATKGVSYMSGSYGNSIGFTDHSITIDNIFLNINEGTLTATTDGFYDWIVIGYP